MVKRLRWVVNGGAALLLLAAAASAFAQAPAAWAPVSGDVRWSCGGKVEMWATWQAERVDGHAIGAIRDYQQHATGTCPPGAGSIAMWKTVTLPFPPLDLSMGPAAGDLAASDETSQCVVVLGGKVAETMPLCNSIAWVPGSQWVVHDNLTPPTIQGSVEQDIVAVPYTGDTAGPPLTIPCGNGLPQLVQAVSGPAVTYLCHGVLHVFSLGAAGATSRTYSFVPVSGPLDMMQPPILVDPTGTYVAVRRSNGWVNVYRLSDGSEFSGTYMAGNPVAWAWSNHGALALMNASGALTVWRLGSGAVTVATPDHPYGYRLLWKPNGSGVLALSTLLTGLGSAPSRGVIVDPNGHTQTFAPALPAGAFVLALTPGVQDMWYGPDPDTAEPAGAFTMSEAPLPSRG